MRDFVKRLFEIIKNNHGHFFKINSLSPKIAARQMLSQNVPTDLCLPSVYSKINQNFIKTKICCVQNTVILGEQDWRWGSCFGRGEKYQQVFVCIGKCHCCSGGRGCELSTFSMSLASKQRFYLWITCSVFIIVTEKGDILSYRKGTCLIATANLPGFCKSHWVVTHEQLSSSVVHQPPSMRLKRKARWCSARGDYPFLLFTAVWHRPKIPKNCELSRVRHPHNSLSL